MSYTDTQVVNESDSIMKAHWGAPKEGAAHALFCSSTQGVDVVPVARNYEMEQSTENLWQSAYQYEGTANIPCVKIVSAEGYSHLSEGQPRLGRIISRTHYAFLPGGQSQVSQVVQAYMERSGDLIDVINTAGIRTKNVIECAYMNYLVDNVSATSLIDHLRGLAFVNAAINSSSNLLSEVLERFEFTNRDEVLQFLERNEFLIALLLESEEKIRAEFNNRVHLILQVVRDPESDHDDELFLIIKTTLSPEEAGESLERFDKNWWIDASSAAQCKFNIDYELV